MRFLKRLLPWCVVAVALAILVFLPDVGPEKYTDLASLFAHERARQNMQGYAVAVVREGALLYKDAFGKDGDGKTLTPMSPMYIGPSSEVVTGALLHSLEKTGHISLDAPIGQYFPRMPASLDSVTLRQIAAHAVNVHAKAFSDLSIFSSPDAPGLEAGELDAQAFWNSRKATGGTTRSRLAYRIVGKALEIATGATFEELVAERIVKPLRLRATGTDPAHLAALARGSGLFFGLAFPYGNQKAATAAASAAMPAASDGIIASAMDMGILLTYIASPERAGGNGITGLSGMAVTDLYKPIIPGGDTGYGWRLRPAQGTHHAAAFQGGSVEGFSSRIVYWPERRAGMVILSAQGGIVQSNIVLPMLAAAAEKIMFEGSAPRLFPVARAMALLAVIWIVYMAVLILQTFNAYSWMRHLKDRCESLNTRLPPWLALIRTSMGILTRLSLFFILPWIGSRLAGGHITLLDLFVLEPGTTCAFVLVCVMGIMRNAARLNWILGSDLALLLFPPRERTP